jgi:hypothetical protein
VGDDDFASVRSLLREIVTDLAKLPLDERASPLHLKVLALRRVVSDWEREAPATAHIDAMLEELRVLKAKVGAIRPTSGVLLRSSDPESLRKVRGR